MPADPKMRALLKLLDQVEAVDAPRVQAAIVQRRRELEKQVEQAERSTSCWRGERGDAPTLEPTSPRPPRRRKRRPPPLEKAISLADLGGADPDDS